MSHLPVLVTDHVSAEPVESAIVARGLRKIYQSYPATTGESSGVFLWLRQLRQALRLTTAAPRTVVALDGIDLDVRRGEILGLMGPNGAGKTTLIKILCGLLDPSEGTARVVGYDVLRDRASVKWAVSYVSTTGWMGLEWALTVEENLRLYATLFGLRGTRARAIVADALTSVGLEEHATKHVYQLSSGMRQRAVLARGLLVPTPLLFLDEPTVGLDPVTARDIRQVVKQELNGSRGQTVVITSHVAAELEHLCDRVGVLLGGQLIALGSVAELCRVVADRTVVELRVSGLGPGTLDAVQNIAGVIQVSSTLHVCGDTPFQRPYCWCPTCERGWIPADEVLGLGRHQILSAELQAWVAETGAELPFQQAAERLERSAGISLGVETVRTHTEQVGTALAERQRTAAATVAQTQEAAEPVDTAPELLVAEVDGVQVRFQDGWHEAKVGEIAGCQVGNGLPDRTRRRAHPCW